MTQHRTDEANKLINNAGCTESQYNKSRINIFQFAHIKTNFKDTALHQCNSNNRQLNKKAGFDLMQLNCSFSTDDELRALREFAAANNLCQIGRATRKLYYNRVKFASIHDDSKQTNETEKSDE